MSHRGLCFQVSVSISFSAAIFKVLQEKSKGSRFRQSEKNEFG